MLRAKCLELEGVLRVLVTVPRDLLVAAADVGGQLRDQPVVGLFDLADLLEPLREADGLSSTSVSVTTELGGFAGKAFGLAVALRERGFRGGKRLLVSGALVGQPLELLGSAA